MTSRAALALGISPERISTIAAGPTPPGGVRATGGAEADPADMERITDAILAGNITVPIAATFPLEQIRDAVTLQAGPPRPRQDRDHFMTSSPLSGRGPGVQVMVDGESRRAGGSRLTPLDALLVRSASDLQGPGRVVGLLGELVA